MKKQINKLSLNKITVNRLDGDDQVKGGGTIVITIICTIIIVGSILLTCNRSEMRGEGEG